MPEQGAHHLEAIQGAGGPRPEILAVHHQVRRHLPAKADAKEAAKEVERPRLMRPPQDRHREALDHQGRSDDRFPPPALRHDGCEEATANAAHGDEAENHRGRHQREPPLDRQGHRIEQHNAMAGAAQAVDQRQGPEGARASHMLGEDLPSQPLDRRTPHHRGRVSRSRPIGREAQVRGAIAEEERQR